MSANTQTAVAQSERFTINQLNADENADLQRYELTIDDAFTVTFIENGPEVVVAETITAHENAAAKHSLGPFLTIAAHITIPESAIDLLESETGMRFEGTRDLSNPLSEDESEPTKTVTKTLDEAM